MKLACLILAYRGAAVLARTVPIYRAAGWDIFVHLDAKADAGTYMAILGESAGACRFVDSMEAYWGGYTMLEAEFRLIEAAWAAGRFDKYLLISDDTIPVFPPRWLNAALEEDRDFVTTIAQEPESKNAADYRKFFFSDHPATMLREHGIRSTEIDDAFLHAMMEIMALKAFGKKQLTIAHGSQFWALTSTSIELVLKTAREDPVLVKSFTYSPSPDETMIQSILLNYVHRRPLDSQPIYADFHSQDGGPRIIGSIEGLPFDLQDSQMFVRRVDPAATRFLDAVAFRLLAGLNAWGSAPEGFHSAPGFVDEVAAVQPIATARLTAPDSPAADGWHPIEWYLERPFRWTAANEVDFLLPLPELAPGRLRVALPLIIAKPPVMANARLRVGDQEAPLRHTRHSLIAEFTHPGLAAGTKATLRTSGLLPGSADDDRMLGVGIGVDPRALGGAG